MKYTFPVITTIDDILPYLEGHDNFIIAQRDGHQIINYNMMYNSFGAVNIHDLSEEDVRGRIIRRECRGLTFDSNGDIIRRPFHKFKNIGEDADTMMDQLNLSSVVVQDKLDGSMIASTMINNEVYWGSKMMSPEFHEMVSEFVDQSQSLYTDFATFLFNENKTPIFEFCSRKNRVVLDYPEDRLTLLSVRDNYTGEYLDKELLEHSAWAYDIPVVKTASIDDLTALKSVNGLVQNVRKKVDIEGYVLKFLDGHMVKIKTDQYVAIHKMKDNIFYERYVLEMAIDNQLDDVYPYLVDSDKDRIKSYEISVTKELNQLTQRLSKLAWDELNTPGMTKKQWAIEHSQQYGAFKSIVFHVFDDIVGGSHLKEDEFKIVFVYQMLKLVKNQCINNQKLEKFKKENGIKWIY